MIDQLQIQNFKTWKDTTELELAPITVFFGGNSSGKSSIGQFLMMLKQTAQSQDRTLALLPGSDQTLVDLGTFEDILSNHDTKQSLDFRLRFRLDQTVEVKDIVTRKSYKGDILQFSSRIAAASTERPLPRCMRFEYQLGSNQRVIIVNPLFRGKKFRPALTAVLELKPENNAEYSLTTTGLKAKRNSGRGWPLAAPYHFYGFPDQVSSYYKNATELTRLAVVLQNCLARISYLGPLREFPHREYSWAGESPQDVGTAGREWLAAYLAAADRKLQPPDSKRKQPFAVVVAAWLKKLGLISSFEVKKISGVRSYQVKVRLHEKSQPVHLPDVGFGVSQVLPVLVQSLYAPAGGTVIMEQPELHLHPAVQSNLADFFVHTTKSRLEDPAGPIQFLLESHSEHFLRRLQRRIADETIPASQVAVYFCTSDESGNSRIERLKMDDYGNILNWPENFFGDQMTDIAEMTKSGNRRRREAKLSNTKPK
jgi:predicted ATPase